MIYRIILCAICSSLCIGVLQAQDNTGTNDQDSSADQTEAREDDYRRRMELEGSRDQDTFSNTTYTSQAKQEKIDKLPKESRVAGQHQGAVNGRHHRKRAMGTL
jgi:hypothetical protein